MEDVIIALEDSTSFHWGKDCLIWIVHYSDGIVEPWTEAEAMRANFSETQKDEYRRAFVSELRMNEAEPFLVSIYSFGSAPLQLKSFGEHISLINSNGVRIKPVSYERVFDEPISGMVQGLVFFKKQTDSDFTLALRGTGVFDERIFSFKNQDEDFKDNLNDSLNDNSPFIASTARQEDLIIIDMPPALPPPPPLEKENIPPVVIEENPKIESAPAFDINTDTDFETNEQIEQNKDNLYISKEKTIQNFINSWIASDTLAMYEMLSEETRKMYSSESFEKEVKKSADFRRGLLSGYKINWIGEERAKIITTKKLLVMRTLISRTFGVIKTGKEWRIVW